MCLEIDDIRSGSQVIFGLKHQRWVNGIFYLKVTQRIKQDYILLSLLTLNVNENRLLSISSL